MNGPEVKQNGLVEFAEWIIKFLIAVAEARIPPSKMTLVPEQGSINFVTGLLGIVLYTAAGQVNAATRYLSLASQFTMASIGAALLFAAAIVVIFTARGAGSIIDDWKKTASVFIVVWLLALVAFLLLTYPLLLVTDNFILLDWIAYSLNDSLALERAAWKDDLLKSLICAFAAGLVLIFRTKRNDPNFSLKSVEPWLWLALMTIVVGFVFDISLYQLSRT
jgi:hypothetical protein